MPVFGIEPASSHLTHGRAEAIGDCQLKHVAARALLETEAHQALSGIVSRDARGALERKVDGRTHADAGANAHQESVVVLYHF